MKKIKQLFSFFVFLVLVATRCIAGTTVNQYQVDDHRVPIANDSIMESQIGYFVNCDVRYFGANRAYTFGLGTIGHVGNCYVCDYGYTFACGCFNNGNSTGCDVLAYAPGPGPYTLTTGAYSVECFCDPPFRCLVPYHFICGCFHLE